MALSCWGIGVPVGVCYQTVVTIPGGLYLDLFAHLVSSLLKQSQC